MCRALMSAWPSTGDYGKIALKSEHELMYALGSRLEPEEGTSRKCPKAPRGP
jgi:hypothetical protein